MLSQTGSVQGQVDTQGLLADQGQSLLDRLDENAHRHAYGVSEDLKYALRESIELLGNEAARQLIARAREQKAGIYSGAGELDPEKLSMECLRYMYRLLFLFYVEARPELGYAPVDNETYLDGYSLEALRDLELVPLNSPREREGTYLHQSLERLFALIDQGFEAGAQHTVDFTGRHGAQAFEMAALKSHLFDPARMQLLKPVVFPNHLLQRVIQLMSLSRPGKGRRRRGRVSYAQLGINQLGAVYESLLSYRGFFAREDLYEVKQAGTTPDELDTGYFVTAAQLEQFTDEEKVYDKDENGHAKLRVHPRGTFIYRLAGRDREKSASYYTPEVLTRCVVKYALKELFREQLDPLPDDAARAQALLRMTVCEPAMGSAAFLNEAINQLADRYLELAQAARGERIPQSEYAAQKQRVKMYLADNNVYGVDLNPVAVELAEVSIWLNALSKDRFVPWLGLQLHAGNSLVGARRETFRADQLRRKSGDDECWLNQAPATVPVSEPLPPGQVWHFLVPDGGMADYADKTVKARYPEAIKAIRAWNRAFTKPFDAEEAAQLERLSQQADALWQEHARQLRQLRARTTDPYDIYGHSDRQHQRTSLQRKDEALAGELLSRGLKNASAYRRLKLAMDYWCALWFWPIDEHEQLPSREEWLFDLENLLGGGMVATGPKHEVRDIFAPTQDADEGRRFVDRFGVLDLGRLYAAFPRLQLAQQIADRRRFFHWQLEFADLFADRGGFDLIVGNPPWIKVEWQEGGVMGDVEPLFVLRKLSATQLRRLRDETFERLPALEDAWREEFEESEGTQNFLNGLVNYPQLQGVKANLYKCFITRAWRNQSDAGATGFLHPEGIYDDPKGGRLRQAVYERLRFHFQFVNELKLFAEVDNHTRYSVNVYGPQGRRPRIANVANLFAPSTLDACFRPSADTEVPGIKREETDENGRLRVSWELRGHPGRLVVVGEEELALFAALYDEAGTPAMQARLPSLHAQPLLEVLRKFAAQPQRLGDLEGEYFSTQHWNEVISQDDGTIRRETKFPSDPSEWILSGPHFFVGTPLYKTPRRECTSNKAYDVIDLTYIPDDYLPRTNYVPACGSAEYLARTPCVSWGDEGSGQLVTEFYRFVNREMIGPSSERTLLATVIPPKVAHVNTTLASVFRSESALLDFASMSFSIVSDYRVKSTGMGHANTSLVNQLPILAHPRMRTAIHVRVLGLVAITQHYRELWERAFNDGFVAETWATERAMPREYFASLRSRWRRHVGLRADLERRQALVELDVLAAQSMDLSLQELVTLYRVQFPVMRQYEAETHYDQSGRIVFTPSKGLPNVGLPRKARTSDLRDGIEYSIRSRDRTEHGIALGWEDIRDLKAGDVVTKTFDDDTLPGGPHRRTIEYHAPFFRPDREEDYRVAWAFFEARFKDH